MRDNFMTQNYKVPWVALLWSAMLPGLGQLYNRDIWIGLFMLVFEVVINVMAHVNWCIYLEFNGNFDQSAKAANIEWMLLYPGGWLYAMWQAYDRAVEINEALEAQELPRKPRSTHLAGAFVGSTVGMLLGVIWHVNDAVILTGLAGGGVGFAFGYALERLLSRQTGRSEHTGGA